MRELRDFATFPHYFSETMRLYRPTSVAYLNAVAGNTEQFIKRNFRVRLITNTVLPGRYAFDLALIENDRFLLTSVDRRRLQQVAESMNFEVDKAPLLERGGVRLPSPLWDYIHQVMDLPLYDRTPYHRGTAMYYLWQLCKYYLWSEKRGAVGLSLAEVARFYLGEVRRVFRSNREVNEAFLRLDRGTLKDIAARVLIVDIPPVDGYQQLPSHLQVREVV